MDIVSYRLQNQQISHATFTDPAEVVRWLGAVQSQDFAGAKWAIGLRTNGLTEAGVDHAFADGSILRTHLLRPTWHFVTPADIRWMLALTAPRVRVTLAYMDRQLGLDKTIFRRCNAVLTKTLQGGKQLTRAELGSALQKKGINTDELRLGHLMMHAELEGVICSGARRGRQFTYALMDERVPQSKKLARDDSIAKLTRRYFTSHGPATLKDFIWWSGLPAAEAKHGLEMVKSKFEHEAINGETYWFANSIKKPQSAGVEAYLLPNYDEFTVGYTDRSYIFDTSYSSKLDARGSILAQNAILIGGQVAGTWKRTLKKNSVAMEAVLFRTLKKSEYHALAEAAEWYGTFLGLPSVLTFGEEQ